jgi:hypothetical protein
MKSDADEKELLKSVERGEWRSAGGGKRGHSTDLEQGEQMIARARTTQLE